MFDFIISKIDQIRKGEKGAVLVFVGLCLLPTLLLAGLAIDTSLGMGQKRKLQNAVDIAARSAVVNGKGDPAIITSKAQNAFAANTTNMANISGPDINVNVPNNTLTISASILVTNTFMKIGGINNSTYNASATVPITNTNVAEVAIVYEVSGRYAGRNFHQNICNSLIDFVNTLPANVMVSITPIATEFLLDPNTTRKENLFSHLSMTANDEAAHPAFYPLSPNLSWTSANYDEVQNPYYFANGVYADYPSDPGVLTSYASPATCPGGYPSCSTKMWPQKCPPKNKDTSCSQVYSYISNRSYPILPLTRNKELVVNYLNGLKNFGAQSDGLFPSFISWGWRTIDPAWKDFWMVNSDASTSLRATGTYPKPYGGVQKSMILIFKDKEYWDDFAQNVADYYINKCGDSTTVLHGLNHWWMSGYGMVPAPTDRQSYVDDITCENKWYKTMDKSLGLNLSDNTNYNATVNTSHYKGDILDEVNNKFFRICNNIKAKDVDIYLLSNANTGTLAPCCNSGSNAYTIGSSSTSITAALNSVKAKIQEKIG